MAYIRTFVEKAVGAQKTAGFLAHFKSTGLAAGFAAISLVLMGAHAPNQEHAAPASRHITVCVTAADFDTCTYGGPAALQVAIDAASSGDVIYVRKGVYVPAQPCFLHKSEAAGEWTNEYKSPPSLIHKANSRHGS